jgi:hypothetical protein
MFVPEQATARAAGTGVSEAPARVSQKWFGLRWLTTPWPLRLSVPAIFIVLAVAKAALPVSFSFAVIVLLAGTAAAAMLAALPKRVRTVALSLFAIAFAVRTAVLVLLFALARQQGGPFLGPDSTTFLRGAASLLYLDFHAGNPVVFFSTANAGYYYVVAGAMRYLHADLFALQMLNAALGAFAAPFVFLIMRGAMPRLARAGGLVTALHPSLVVLSAVDLLKDPLVIATSLVSIWAIAEIVRRRWSTRLIWPVAAGAVALGCLRLTRFYVNTELEVAAAVALGWLVWRRRHSVRLTAGPVILLVAIFAVSDVVPTAFGWPTSVQLFVAQVRRAVRPGALDVQEDAATARAIALSREAGASTEPGGAIVPNMVGGSGPIAIESAPAESRPTSVADELAQRGLVTWPAAVGALRYGETVLRRIVAPLPRILPRWRFRDMQANAVLMYPGTFCWYVLLPLTCVGWWLVLGDARRGAAVQFPIAFLWLFMTAYFLPYFALEFAYSPVRQREDMAPIFVIFAAIGFIRMARRQRFQRGYALYWICLSALVVVHAIVRASHA